jgi:hypothetical protein
MKKFFKALASSHKSKAQQLEKIASRLEEEFSDTAGYAHKLKLEAQNQRVEADIVEGKIKPVNSEYID